MFCVKLPGVGNAWWKLLSTWTSSAGHAAHVWCVCARAHVRAPDTWQTHWSPFQLPYIFWSGAFISTLLNVSAGKVGSFDALGSPLIPQKCHPVVNAEAIPLSLEQICCVNNSKSREAESSSRTKKEVHDTGLIIRFQTTLTSSRQRLGQLQSASALPTAPSCGWHIHSTLSLSVTASNN